MHFNTMKRIDIVAFFAKILVVIDIFLAFLTNNQHLEVLFWILAVIGVIACFIAILNSVSKCLDAARTFLTILSNKV